MRTTVDRYQDYLAIGLRHIYSTDRHVLIPASVCSQRMRPSTHALIAAASLSIGEADIGRG